MKESEKNIRNTVNVYLDELVEKRPELGGFFDGVPAPLEPAAKIKPKAKTRSKDAEMKVRKHVNNFLDELAVKRPELGEFFDGIPTSEVFLVQNEKRGDTQRAHILAPGTPAFKTKLERMGIKTIDKYGDTYMFAQQSEGQRNPNKIRTVSYKLNCFERETVVDESGNSTNFSSVNTPAYQEQYARRTVVENSGDLSSSKVTKIANFTTEKGYQGLELSFGNMLDPQLVSVYYDGQGALTRVVFRADETFSQTKGERATTAHPLLVNDWDWGARNVKYNTSFVTVYPNRDSFGISDTVRPLEADYDLPRLEEGVYDVSTALESRGRVVVRNNYEGPDEQVDIAYFPSNSPVFEPGLRIKVPGRANVEAIRNSLMQQGISFDEVIQNLQINSLVKVRQPGLEFSTNLA